MVRAGGTRARAGNNETRTDARATPHRRRDKPGGSVQGVAVPQKQWIIELGDARILVSRATARGNVESFAVVLLVWTDAGWECATRYDCAHGFAHRDVLGRRAGLLYKQSFAGLTRAEIFRHALRDFQKNHPACIAFYLAH